jgi:hypothetical protein
MLMSAQMMQPNWFDKKYEKAMARMIAEQALAEIAKDSRVVSAVKDALTEHDAKNQPGPSRTQAIRNALCHVLEEIN